MPVLYEVNVTVHVLAAMFWLGGMLFLGLVGAPVLRTVEPEAVRQQLFQQLGVRFRAAGWWAIGVLLATGAINLFYHGWLHWHAALGNVAFWRSGPGHTLVVKLVAVAAMILISAVHDFHLGPMAGRAVPGSPRAQVLRQRVALLARVNVACGVIVVIAAVRLARGG
jgi:putative copper export protein